jgi:integrase/recombinase XerD
VDSLDQVVRSYLDHLAVERGLSRNTLSSYSRDLRRYTAFLRANGVAAIQDVTETTVSDFVASLRSGADGEPVLRASSAARAVVAARGLHRFALREGLSPHDPAAAVRPPTPPQRLPRALPLDDVLALVEAAGFDGTPKAVRDQALLEFLYGTGARIGEAVGLDVDDLDLERGTVMLHGKGGKDRVVPVGGFARAAIDAYLVRGRPTFVASGAGRTASGAGRTGSGAGRTASGGRAASASGGNSALFLNARGGRLSRQSAWTILQATAERAGLRVTIGPHTLRHSFATHLLDGGADVRVVQELLGHASVTTTQVYTLVTVDKLREVYATAHPRARAK